MSLLLQDIYSETKDNYHLELVCGAGGLNRLMNWVYVAEDIATTDFLHGGELIITTGSSVTPSLLTRSLKQFWILSAVPTRNMP